MTLTVLICSRTEDLRSLTYRGIKLGVPNSRCPALYDVDHDTNTGIASVY